MGQGVWNVSTNPSLLDEDFYGDDQPLKKPSKLFLLSSFISIVIGFAVGIYGTISTSSFTVAQDYAYGFLGYALTALLPIVLLQIFKIKHKSALANNHEEPYDIYAGSDIEKKFLKLVMIGLISAGFSIWVFLQPIAKIYA
jgi:hypothetical protein